MRTLVVARRASQAIFLATFISILWSTTYPLTGLLPPEAFFAINPLIMVLTSVSERILLPGLIYSIAMLALSLIFGRFFCGWVCPLGTTIDMIGALRKRGRPAGDSANRKLRRAKFIILGVLVLASFFGMQLAWAFDPMVIMARFVSLNLIPFATLTLNSVFILLIKGLHLSGPVYDFYHLLKATILGIRPYYFSHSWLIFITFLFVCGIALIMKRLWCRMACPLGGLYSLVARSAPLRRTVRECGGCQKCKSLCRMGAIKDDLGTVRGECILCMDCVYDCAQNVTRFAWRPATEVEKAETPPKEGGGGVSRRDFLLLLLSSLFALGFRNRTQMGGGQGGVIRPPGALGEEHFVNRCIRCGNCMKVCITNGLQPVMFQSGLEGIWTPQLVPEIGYCEYRCTLCGDTCPTSAIPSLSLEAKQKVRLGLAEIDRSICLPWALGRECIVCQEHCPVFQKAIKLTREGALSKPSIDEELCIGCGICQNKCPVRPVRAVRVSPRNSDRT